MKAKKKKVKKVPKEPEVYRSPLRAAVWDWAKHGSSDFRAFISLPKEKT